MVTEFVTLNFFAVLLVMLFLAGLLVSFVRYAVGGIIFFVLLNTIILSVYYATYIEQKRVGKIAAIEKTNHFTYI